MKLQLNHTKTLLIMATLFLLPTVMFAQMQQRGRVTYQKLSTSILPGYTERDYAIYLPKSYSTDTDKRYPVLYLLHGGGGTFSDWPEQGHLAGFANEIIDSGAACEMIIVCPDGKQQNTMWFNAENWPGADHFFNELIPHIDKTYRTIPDKKHRAVAGLSMGGGGSIVYATSRPDMFSAVYAVSAYVERLAFIDNPNTEWFQKEVDRNNCIRLFENATPDQLKAWKELKWLIDCGDDDFTYDSNANMITAMRKQQVPYQLRIRDGGHTWQYWMTSLYLMLPFASNSFMYE